MNAPAGQPLMFTDSTDAAWEIPRTFRSLAMVKMFTGVDLVALARHPDEAARQLRVKPAARVREAAVAVTKFAASAAGVSATELFHRIDDRAVARLVDVFVELAVTCPLPGDTEFGQVQRDVIYRARPCSTQAETNPPGAAQPEETQPW